MISFLYNYFGDLKLFSDFYLFKFVDTSAVVLSMYKSMSNKIPRYYAININAFNKYN